MLIKNTYLTQTQFRQDSSTNWKEANVVLASGEPGYEVDTGLFKIGNGVTAWNDLPYCNTFRALVPEVEADGKLYARTRDINSDSGKWQSIEIPDITNKANKTDVQFKEVLLFPDTCSQLYFGNATPLYNSIGKEENNNPRQIMFQADDTFFAIIQTVDNKVSIAIMKDIHTDPIDNIAIYNGTVWEDRTIEIEDSNTIALFTSVDRTLKFINKETNELVVTNLLEDEYDGEYLINSLDLCKTEIKTLDLIDVFENAGKVDDVTIINNDIEESIVQGQKALIPNFTTGESNIITQDITKLSKVYSITFNSENPIKGNFICNLSNIHLIVSKDKNYISLNSIVLFDGETWTENNVFYNIFSWDKNNKRLTPTNVYEPGFNYDKGTGVQPDWSIIGDIAPTNGLLTSEIYNSIDNKKVDKISEETFIPVKVGDIANTLYLRKPETLPTETTLIGIKVEDEEEDRLAIALTPEGKITLENALNNFDGTGSELYNGTEFVSAGGTAMSITIYFNESTGELRFVPFSSIEGKNLVISSIANIVAPTYVRGIKDNFDLSDMYTEYKTYADKKSIVDTFELSQNILEGYEDGEICLNRTTGGNLLYGSYINITDAIMNAGETFTYKLPSGIYNVIQYSGIWNTLGDINERYTIPFSSREFSCYIKQDNTNSVTFNIENNGDRDVTIGNASLYIVYNKEGE